MRLSDQIKRLTLYSIISSKPSQKERHPQEEGNQNKQNDEKHFVLLQNHFF